MTYNTKHSLAKYFPSGLRIRLRVAAAMSTRRGAVVQFSSSLHYSGVQWDPGFWIILAQEGNHPVRSREDASLVKVSHDTAHFRQKRLPSFACDFPAAPFIIGNDGPAEVTKVFLEDCIGCGANLIMSDFLEENG